MYRLKQAGSILIAICMTLTIAGCGNAVTNNKGTESEQYSGLYIMGEAVEGADHIKNLSGTITIEAI